MSKHATKLTEEGMKSFLIEEIKKQKGIIIDPQTQCLFQNILEYNNKVGADLCIEKKVIVVHENKLHELGSIDYDRFFDEQSTMFSDDIKGDNKAIKIFLKLCAKRINDDKVIVPSLPKNYDFLESTEPASLYAA